MTRGKALACLLGVLFFFFGSVGVWLLFDGRWTLMAVADAALYGVAGAALGYFWPEDGWRLGAWLGLCRLILIPFNYFLVGDTIDWEKWSAVQEVKDLLSFLMPVLVGCFGAALGALAGERRRFKHD